MGQTLQCGQCGAPLRPEAAKDGFIRCEYCGAITSILPDSPQQPIQPVSSSPQILLNQREVMQSVSSGFKVASIIAIVVGLLVPLGIGLSIYFVFSKASRVMSGHRISTSIHRHSGPRQVSSTKACLVHANDDEVADVGLLMSTKSGKSVPVRVHFFDGVTGKHISESALLGSLTKPKVACLGDRYVGVQGADLKLHVVPARSPEKAVTVLLPDKLEQVAATADCARIQTDDDAVTQIRLATGETTKCKTGPLHRITETPGMPGFKKTRIFHAGSITYEVAAKRRGIRFLTVSAKQKKKRLWQWKLDVTATKFGIPAVMTPNTLVIVGAAYPEKDFAYLAGLQLATGRKRFSLRLKGRSIGTFGTGILYNGKWVLLTPGDGVTAFDPDSGKLVWRIE